MMGGIEVRSRGGPPVLLYKITEASRLCYDCKPYLHHEEPPMRTFVYSDGKSNKFWNIEQTGNSFTVTYGKVGSKGRSTTKTCDDEFAAGHARNQLIAEKLSKGYVETTASSGSASSPLLTALEDALAENPDDLASHSARADYLIDQGDPRGEFAQVQLALEDPNQSAETRKKLRKREEELLAEHRQDWLGGLSRFLSDDWWGDDKPLRYRFARGWLDSLRLHPYPEALVAVMARSPEVRLLRRLEVVYDMHYHPFEFDDMTEALGGLLTEEEGPFVYDEAVEGVDLLPAIVASPYLTNLRVFELGYHNAPDHRPVHTTMVFPFERSRAEQIVALLEKCPHLEELYLNAHVDHVEQLFASPSVKNLRVFQYYFGSGYPLADLAKNTHWKNLTTLRLHPGRDAVIELAEMEAILHSSNLPNLNHLQISMTPFGDEGVAPIIDSGILKRLRIFDLSVGGFTDDGAQRLAACPDLKHLERLDVSRNALTQAGIDALEATGINVVALDQHNADETDYRRYEVDVE